MPRVRPNESQESFIKRCIPEVIREGKKPQQATAICHSMYRQKKK